jgi:hypothetical protein
MILDDEEIFVEQLSNTNAFDILYENFDDSRMVHDWLEAVGFLYESPLMVQYQTQNIIKIQRVGNKDLLFLIVKYPNTRSIQVHIYSTAMMNHYVANNLRHKLLDKYKLTGISTGTLNYNYTK